MDEADRQVAGLGRPARDRLADRGRHPAAAEQFFTAAEEVFELLRRHPRIGRLRSSSVTGVRSWVVPDFQNYIVFYLARETEVQILAVLHGARDLSSALAARLD